MRKIIVGQFVSVDGVMEGPGPADDFARAGWTMPYFSEDVGAVIGANIARSGGLILGRKTYQGFKDAFSAQTDEMSTFLNNTPKFVVSTTLKSADWKNSTLIGKNVISEITKLKEQPGPDLFINGSISLVHSLMEHNLIDEYSLLLHPVVVGAGRRLFEAGNTVPLKLTESRTLKMGVVLLNFEVEKKA